MSISLELLSNMQKSNVIRDEDQELAVDYESRGRLPDATVTTMPRADRDCGMAAAHLHGASCVTAIPTVIPSLRLGSLTITSNVVYGKGNRCPAGWKKSR